MYRFCKNFQKIPRYQNTNLSELIQNDLDDVVGDDSSLVPQNKEKECNEHKILCHLITQAPQIIFD
jgi:hypothetical protein